MSCYYLKKNIYFPSIRRSLPFYLVCFLFFLWTDIYIGFEIKAVYLFSIPIIINSISRLLIVKKIDRFLLLWFLSYFFSIGHIYSFNDYIRIVVGQLVLFCIYSYFGSIRTYTKYYYVQFWFQLFLFFMILVGSVQLVLFYAVGSTWGISHLDHGVLLPRMRAFCLESDWYGFLCAISFLNMLFVIIGGRFLYSKKIDKIILVVSFLMLLLSLVRAAWVVVFSAMFVFFFLAPKQLNNIKRKTIRISLLSILFLSFVLVIGSFFDIEIIEKLGRRLNVFTWISGDSGSMYTRFSSYEIMLKFFLEHPFSGNGVGGMGAISFDYSLLQSMGYYGEISTGRGNANVLLGNLFDVGIFGTLFLFLYFLNIIRALLNFSKRYDEIECIKYVVIILGLIAGFMFGNGIRQTYVWVLLGLANSIMIISKKKFLEDKSHENRN